jgi:hypothetical protein
MARGCTDFQEIDREGEGVREGCQQVSFDGSGGSAADALDEEGNFDAATKRDEDENEEDEQWHRSLTTDEANFVGDGKKWEEDAE